jgi:hypothetical protein
MSKQESTPECFDCSEWKRKNENQKDTIQKLTSELARHLGLTGLIATAPFEVLEKSRERRESPQGGSDDEWIGFLGTLENQLVSITSEFGEESWVHKKISRVIDRIGERVWKMQRAMSLDQDEGVSQRTVR